ncbi:hypothetical protein CLU79DRAFT_41659, partial [Phycomyces nitens]
MVETKTLCERYWKKLDVYPSMHLQQEKSWKRMQRSSPPEQSNLQKASGTWKTKTNKTKTWSSLPISWKRYSKPDLKKPSSRTLPPDNMVDSTITTGVLEAVQHSEAEDIMANREEILVGAEEEESPILLSQAMQITVFKPLQHPPIRQTSTNVRNTINKFEEMSRKTTENTKHTKTRENKQNTNKQSLCHSRGWDSSWESSPTFLTKLEESHKSSMAIVGYQPRIPNSIPYNPKTVDRKTIQTFSNRSTRRRRSGLQVPKFTSYRKITYPRQSLPLSILYHQGTEQDSTYSGLQTNK